MSTTDIKRKIKRTPEEWIANKQRIAQAKARALRWAEQRKLLREHATTTETTVTVPQPLETVAYQEQVNPQSLDVLSPEQVILQYLLSRRTALQQELSELELTISVLRRTYSI